MKNGLLVCKGTSNIKNIGDYIQSLSSEIFFEHIDDYVEREELRDYKSADKVKLIIHGWFMWNPKQWPPSNDIRPLITSFHIVPKIAEQLLSMEGISYMKKHAPIGCRDIGTMELLKSKGIPAYYSSCLTLVLGEKYKRSEKANNVIFVDPYFEYRKNSNRDRSIIRVIKSVLNLIRYFFTVKKLAKRFLFEPEPGRFSKYFRTIDKYIATAAFYGTYISFFEPEVLLNAEYILHTIPENKLKTEKEKFDIARNLVNKYASAKLVVTSRIHCALPCLGVETPVIFVTSSNLETSEKAIRSVGRFGGIMDLFRVLDYRYGKLSTDDCLLDKYKFKASTIPLDFNKMEYLEYKEKLIKQCKSFVADID